MLIVSTLCLVHTTRRRSIPTFRHPLRSKVFAGFRILFRRKDGHDTSHHSTARSDSARGFTRRRNRTSDSRAERHHGGPTGAYPQSRYSGGFSPFRPKSQVVLAAGRSSNSSFRIVAISWNARRNDTPWWRAALAASPSSSTVPVYSTTEPNPDTGAGKYLPPNS